MSALMGWVQKLYSYWFRQDRKEQNDEQEKQDDGQEKRQNTIGREEQPRMLLILRDLQRTMDPLIAAQVYNNNHSSLIRLPEELLLCILHYLGDDLVTLYCVRRVSRKFRRLVNSPDIWKYTSVPLWERFMYLTDCQWNIPADEKKQLQQRLRRDGMCDKCILWYDIPANLSCKFETLCGPRLHCDSCGSHRQVSSFSLSNQQPYMQERRCLGCQGAVQLCQHIHISWATIETHITHWQRRKPGDWQACFDDFNVECHDPSHDTRCRGEDVPTWPRARLQGAASAQDLVVLNLEWKPHSGLKAFTPTSDGRAPAAELRALFRSYRQGPADNMLPSYPSNLLPEMVCFDPANCDCVHYERGDNKRPNAADPSNPTGFFRNDLTFRSHGYHHKSHHKFYRCHGRGWCGQRVDMSKHWPMGMSNSVCLITAYQSDILVCRKTDRNKINPTHEWFHAMDPETYPRPNITHGIPLCKDMDCMNYYRRPRSFRACGSQWPFPSTAQPDIPKR